MRFSTNSVISADGTTIGYRYTGTGPGLIICHGGGRISQNYEKLALELADRYTVYIPDRRGRGLSGPEGSSYNINKACEDLVAVLKATHASFVFGHSAGGLIALETMLLYPVEKIALYEPPISINGSLPTDWLTDFEKALEKGRRKRAMAISLKGLRVIEGVEKMPYRLIMVLINVIALADRKKEKGTRMLDLLPTLVADVKMAIVLDSLHQHYKHIKRPALLMAGSKSPSYFRLAIKELEEVLPSPTMQIFEGLDHYSPEEKVTDIGNSLKNFFGPR
jgi:pimeloyl-ACP methyl ester carboxylesterase